MPEEHDLDHLLRLATRTRYLILKATGAAGSGHPTSSLSAVELMVALLFDGHFRYDPDRPEHPNNDRLIFSKGHASPLLYALWAVAGALTEEELMGYRTFHSPLEGHPSRRFPHAEATTGSLGQGLSIGVGMALNAKLLDQLPYRTWVLLGDSEMAEGSQWEAIQLAAHYQLDNLTGILDVNRLGQRGETMYGRDLDAYRQRIEAFGWRTLTVDGHSLDEVSRAYTELRSGDGRPSMVIAETVKGKGVEFVEDRNGFHGKALGGEELERALSALGKVDPEATGSIRAPEDLTPPERPSGERGSPDYARGEEVPTRTAYGKALVRLAPSLPDLISLDGEVSNSTRADYLKEEHPERFLEMYIAEQNMVGAALGLSLRGKRPFVSSFAAFLSRAADQIRMNQYSDPHITYVGSHAGVSIGQDGPSQMGLEDLALFRSLLDSVVLYPCDAVSCERMVELAAEHAGTSYIRTTRGATPVIYSPDDTFRIGGSMVLRSSPGDVATIVAAGITVHEALAAWVELGLEGVSVRVIDAYSVKPLDVDTLRTAARETGGVVTVEDHRPEGGLGEAVASVLADIGAGFASLAVRKKPRSGTPEELMAFEEIDRYAIISAVRRLT
jgi:transketolase